VSAVAVDGDPEVPSHPFFGRFLEECRKLSPDRFKNACLHAQRSGDLSPVIALLRSYHPLDKLDQNTLADLLQQAKLKRPRGNPRQGDPWVALATEVALEDKIFLPLYGWKKSKGGSKIDDIAIDTAVAYMLKHGYPMRPDVETFKEKVRTKLHRGRKSAAKHGTDCSSSSHGIDSRMRAYLLSEFAPGEEEQRG
jgi:hypothetical protein